MSGNAEKDNGMHHTVQEVNPMSRRYLRLPEVLSRIPVSKSTWWAGVRKGIFPKSIKLSPRVTVWLEADIDKVGVSNGKEQISGV